MKTIRYDNIRPITDPSVAEMIKSVTDQMDAKGRTETRREREERLVREDINALEKERDLQLAARHPRLRVVKTMLAERDVIAWLDKKKPRR